MSSTHWGAPPGSNFTSRTCNSPNVPLCQVHSPVMPVPLRNQRCTVSPPHICGENRWTSRASTESGMKAAGSCVRPSTNHSAQWSALPRQCFPGASGKQKSGATAPRTSKSRSSPVSFCAASFQSGRLRQCRHSPRRIIVPFGDRHEAAHGSDRPPARDVRVTPVAAPVFVFVGPFPICRGNTAITSAAVSGKQQANKASNAVLMTVSYKNCSRAIRGSPVIPRQLLFWYPVNRTYPILGERCESY